MPCDRVKQTHKHTSTHTITSKSERIINQIKWQLIKITMWRELQEEQKILSLIRTLCDKVGLCLVAIARLPHWLRTESLAHEYAMQTNGKSENYGDLTGDFLCSKYCFIACTWSFDSYELTILPIAWIVASLKMSGKMKASEIKVKTKKQQKLKALTIDAVASRVNISMYLSVMCAGPHRDVSVNAECLLAYWRWVTTVERKNHSNELKCMTVAKNLFFLS